MAYTYDITTDRGKVRWRVGDTTDNGHLLEDAEIDAVLTENNSNLAVSALRCCEAVIAKLAKDADRSVVGINTSRSQKFQQYMDLLGELRSRASVSSKLTAYSGGASISRNDSIEDDTDFNAPPFKVGKDDNPPVTDADGDDV